MQLKYQCLPLIEFLSSLYLKILKLIEYQGSRKTGGYVLTEKGKAFVKSLIE